MTIDQFLVELGEVDELYWTVFPRPRGLIRGHFKERITDAGLLFLCPISAVHLHRTGHTASLVDAIDELGLTTMASNVIMSAADDRWADRRFGASVRERMLEILKPVQS